MQFTAPHRRDIEVPQKCRVDYEHYWSDGASGTVSCLLEAPDAEAGAAVRRAARGRVADDVVPVQEGA
ncbi:MAG: hypothetical protein AVDCRST_MAG57-2515 [uncultured Blastococcus sp.]|uniref:Uncharacterized protein n=1 Tax=uncultured Blastococcus sp. TaxID=217144 RepID=A0A6J4IQ05_9ACTN|nr:MAG: hypothetical protein AVDCRST_MAG57-2515 [uncultured Blastococcus sp.]